VAGWLQAVEAAACWAVRQDAKFGAESVEKLLGALPVVAGFCSRLKIRDVIDDACPVRDLAELTHGQVIEALVANRLTSPSPLVHVQSRARDWAVGEALGVEPALLNDDRIGRPLDAIAPHLDQIAGSVGVAAIAAFGIDVSRLHWDMSAISVHGEYSQNEEGFAAPRRLLIVGDSKLVSYANLAAMDGDGVTFVARRPRPTSRPRSWPGSAWSRRRRSTTSPSVTRANPLTSAGNGT
jgi:hypothetical protein